MCLSLHSGPSFESCSVTKIRILVISFNIDGPDSILLIEGSWSVMKPNRRNVFIWLKKILFKSFFLFSEMDRVLGSRISILG